MINQIYDFEFAIMIKEIFYYQKTFDKDQFKNDEPKYIIIKG